MPQIRRTPKARKDAVEIWSYISAENEAAADRVIDKIDSRLRSLSQMPDSGTAVPFMGSAVRRSPIERYVIYYRPIEGGIEVLRILHERRQHDGLV